MPLYDFECAKCQRRFEELVRGADDLRDLRCPACGSEDVERQVSAACVGTSGWSGSGGDTASAGGSCCCGGGGCSH